MIQPAKADVICPAVAANQPDRFINHRIGIGDELARVRIVDIRQMFAQFDNLFTAHFRRGLSMKLFVQFSRQLVSKLTNQTHHAGAMLIDGQTET